jgi:hypothetical protein
MNKTDVQFQRGFVVRKKYLDSNEWAYFAGETDYAYMWTPESAIGGGRGGVAVFSTEEKAENFANHIKEYHEWRRRQGKASGFDVEVAEVHFTEEGSITAGPQPTRRSTATKFGTAEKAGSLWQA